MIRCCCCKPSCRRPVIVNRGVRGRVLHPDCSRKLRQQEDRTREDPRIQAILRAKDRATAVRPAMSPLRAPDPAGGPGGARPLRRPDRPRPPATPPPLPADGPGRWALIPEEPGYCLNDTTGVVMTAWRPTSRNGNPDGQKPIGPWKAMTWNLRCAEPRIKLRTPDRIGSGSGVPVRVLVERTFGPDVPYFRTIRRKAVLA